MTDSDCVLFLLRQCPHTTMDLIERSRQIRGFGLTPHSRVADLRRAGCEITCRRLPGGERPRYLYTLVSEPQDAGVVDPPARVEQEQRSEIEHAAAPLDAPIPGQLRLVG